MNLIMQPGSPLSLGQFLQSHLQDPNWREFRAAIAFVKYSGARHIIAPLAEFVKRGRVRLSVGVDFAGTTAEGLKSLIDCVGPKNEVWVYHNEIGATFHPKFFMFKGVDGSVDIAVGSGNLTEGGIFTNYEAAMAVRVDPTSKEGATVVAQAESALDAWCDVSSGLARLVDQSLIEKLLEQGYILTERQCAKLKGAKATGLPGSKAATKKPLFATASIAKPPPPPKWVTVPAFAEPGGTPAEPVIPPAAGVTGFVMTLQQTDVGVGQLSAGASRRSPEIFIPLKARDYAPLFWGWPLQFAPDTAKPGKMDRPGVKMWLGTHTIDVNMMTWPDKHDFRLRSESLRSAGNIGDILRMEKADSSIGFDYLAYIVPMGTMEHRHYLTFCVNKAAGKSEKLWGYY